MVEVCISQDMREIGRLVIQPSKPTTSGTGGHDCLFFDRKTVRRFSFHLEGVPNEDPMVLGSRALDEALKLVRVKQG